jgi:hypothetical protein
MKVKELIELLSKFDQELPVFYYVEERDSPRCIGKAEEQEVEKSYDPATDTMHYETAIVLYESRN